VDSTAIKERGIRTLKSQMNRVDAMEFSALYLRENRSPGPLYESAATPNKNVGDRIFRYGPFAKEGDVKSRIT
jgi:hypothetical protein